MPVVLTLLGALAVLTGPRTAFGDDWANYKGDCDQIMAKAESAPLPRLKECVGLWIAYVDPAKAKANQAGDLQKTFQSLYNRSVDKGDDEGEYLARSASDRAGIRLTFKKKAASPKGSTEKPTEAKAEPKRKKFVPPDVSARDRRKADKEVKKGIKYFKKKKRDKAIAAYERALEYDPGNLDALFNHAAELAHRNERKRSVEQLQKLQDIGSKPALARLKEARIDRDFENLHDYVPYKRVTGYAKIKVVNSLGEYGEDEVNRIVKTSKKLKYEDIEEGVDKKKNRTQPVIWFKEHSTTTAWMMKEIVIHPGTIMTRINWDTPYDVIVSWGNKIVKRDGVKQPQKDFTDVSPDKQEKRLDDLSRKQDKALREPEKVARKVDHAVETPQRVTNKVEGGVKRVERTVDTIEKTGNKLDGLFK